MKNKYWFTTLTTLVAVVFLLSLLSPLSAAQKPVGKGGNPSNGVGVSGNPHEKLSKFQNTGKPFEDAKAQFETALRQFNTKKDGKSKQELMEKGKGYLGSAIDRIDAYLDVLKSRTENPENQGVFPFDASKNIDSHAAKLEQLRAKVQQDNSTGDLRDDNQELKDEYSKIRLETQYGFEILLNNRIDKFLSKSDNVTARLDAAIQNLKSKGKDTSKLEAISLNFAQLMRQVTTEQQSTKALLATHTGFDESGKVINNADAQAFSNRGDQGIKETVKTLKDAERQLQDFVKEYRRLSGGIAAGQQGNENEHEGKTLASGNSTLVANGSGRAVISGNVTVILSGINDTLIVSNNANVTTDGGTNQTLGNGRIKYQGFNSTTIKGDNITAAISGNNISLTVTCMSTTTACAAVLNGNGTFSTSGTGNLSVSGEWGKGNSITDTSDE